MQRNNATRATRDRADAAVLKQHRKANNEQDPDPSRKWTTARTTAGITAMVIIANKMPVAMTLTFRNSDQSSQP